MPRRTDAPASPRDTHIADVLTTEIVEGKWKPGDRLPAVAALARRFHCREVPVRSALGQLEKRGIIVRQADNGPRRVAGPAADGTLHQRVMREIREMIEGKLVLPGQAFPTPAALAKRCGCSVSTVRRALDSLEERGIIVRQMTRPADVARASPRRSPYEQVVEHIIAGIVAGTWKPGQPLPSHAAMARRLRCSTGSVALAMEQLAERGFVVRQGPRHPVLVAGPGVTAYPTREQVVDRINAAITGGTWKPGEQLPSKAALAQLLSCSKGTLNTALNALIARGVLLRQHGPFPPLVAGPGVTTRPRRE